MAADPSCLWHRRKDLVQFQHWVCKTMLKPSRSVTSHHISGKDTQRSGKYALQYTSGQFAGSSSIQSPCPVCAHEYWVPLVSYSLQIHCKFSIDSYIQVFGFLRELIETLSGCSTHPGLGMTQKGPSGSLNCPTCLPTTGPKMDGYAACQCEGSLKARFVATKSTHLDNLRKNQLRFFRSFWYLCASANEQSARVSDRMDGAAQVHTHPRPDSFKSVQIDTDQPGLLTDML